MSVDAAAMEAELAAFKDPKLARGLIDSIQKLAPAEGATLMEVCGTHTVAIARNGIRALMPEGVKLSSGPGCPVCVTSNHDIDAVIALARVPEVTIATFGDMTRVPGSTSSLLAEQAAGRDVRIVYSPLDALALAQNNPDRRFAIEVVDPDYAQETIDLIMQFPELAGDDVPQPVDAAQPVGAEAAR